MKIVVFTSKDDDGVTHQRMEIDGKRRLSVGRPEPEDAIIGRDLISCTTIAKLMKEAHEARCRGEALDIEEAKDPDV